MSQDLTAAREAAQQLYGYTADQAEAIPGETAEQILSNAAFGAPYLKRPQHQPEPEPLLDENGRLISVPPEWLE